MTSSKDASLAVGSPASGNPSPAPGAGVSYDAQRAVNWSALKWMNVSPLRYKWALTHPEPPKPAYVLGSAIHCGILEPERFGERFAVFDGTRRGKEWDLWRAEHPGVESLKPDEMEQVHRCVDAVRLHKVASGILKGCRTEETTSWVDPDTRVACKGRLDAICAAYVCDLKTSRDVAPRAFERHSASYLYHGQLAWYHDGATVCGKIPGDVMPYVVTAQTSEPYDVAAYQLTPETLVAGRTLYRGLLNRLVQCMEADWWPGVAPDLEPLMLPRWAAGNEQAAIEEEF